MKLQEIQEKELGRRENLHEVSLKPNRTLGPSLGETCVVLCLFEPSLSSKEQMQKQENSQARQNNNSHEKKSRIFSSLFRSIDIAAEIIFLLKPPGEGS